MNVIIVYATKHGSTQGVAGAVADALRERGAQVTLRPARAVREPVAGYGLVVLGAALYSGRWHRDAHRFLKRHRRELAGVPVAVFGMGPRSDTEDAWQRSRAQLDRALGKHRWLSPAAVTGFGGVTRPGAATTPSGTCATGRPFVSGPPRPAVVAHLLDRGEGQHRQRPVLAARPAASNHRQPWQKLPPRLARGPRWTAVAAGLTAPALTA